MKKKILVIMLCMLIPCSLFSMEWELDKGVLTITGEGDMMDFPMVNLTPWYNYGRFINKIVVSEGITKIGKYAFAGCLWATEVQLPSTLKIIGKSAFEGDVGLYQITIPKSVKLIDNKAFYECKYLHIVSLYNDYDFENMTDKEFDEYIDNRLNIKAQAFVNTDITDLEIPDHCDFSRDAFDVRCNYHYKDIENFAFGGTF